MAYYVILATIRVGTNVTTIGSGVITQGAAAQSIAALADGAVSTEKLADGAVTSEKVGWTTMRKWVPDYTNAGASSTPPSTVTATADGWYDLHEICKYGDDSRLEIKVNENVIIKMVVPTGQVIQFSGLIQVIAGDVIKLTFNVDAGSPKMRFIPGKWA